MDLILTIKRRARSHQSSGFTLIEILCTVSIFFIIAAGMLKIYNICQERDKLIRTRIELIQLADMLEEYHKLHGDYPKIVAHNDAQGSVLYAALHGQINPNGDVLAAEKQIDLVTVSIREINGKFVDPFLSDYIYYYKPRTDHDTWNNPSYVLLSKGPKGQQNPKRDLTISKGVTISTTGNVSGQFNGDVLITNGGFL